MTDEERKCPECNEIMEFHPKTCIGFCGNISEGKHWFCAHCNIEAFPETWRRGK